MKAERIGAKLLRGDQSLNGRMTYPIGREITVPGNGAYVAVTGGLTSADGDPDTLALFLGRKPTGAEAPPGVICFQVVERIALTPKNLLRLDARMRGMVACFAPNLSPERRMQLARKSTPEWRGVIACYAPGLSPERRMQLARKSTRKWCGEIAHDALNLSFEQRMQLARKATPKRRAEIACFALNLSPEQRMQLARESTLERRRKIARDAPGLSPEQRMQLARKATPKRCAGSNGK